MYGSPSIGLLSRGVASGNIDTCLNGTQADELIDGSRKGDQLPIYGGGRGKGDAILTDQHGNQARSNQQPPKGFSESSIPVTRLQVVRQGGIIGI